MAIFHCIATKGSMPKKNPEKVWSFAKPGGGVSEGKQKTKPQVWGLKKGQKWPKMA